MDRIVKLIQKGNPLLNGVKDICCSLSAVTKIMNEFKINVGGLKRENILVDHERHKSAKIKYRKALCVDTFKKN